MFVWGVALDKESVSERPLSLIAGECDFTIVGPTLQWTRSCQVGLEVVEGAICRPKRASIARGVIFSGVRRGNESPLATSLYSSCDVILSRRRRFAGGPTHRGTTGGTNVDAVAPAGSEA